MSAQDFERYSVPALNRGLALLAQFSREQPELTAPDLAKRLALPRSTVFRLLVTLEQLGFVQRTADGRAWRLGLAVLRLGFEYLASLSLVEHARPLLESLRDATGYSASLVVRDGREVVYLFRAPPHSPFSTAVSVGTRLPAHATVLGQVLLADQTPAQIQALFPEARLQRFTDHTPANGTSLAALVKDTAERGHVVAEGHYEAHIGSVAVPVLAEGGRLVAAIGLTVPGPHIPAGLRQDLVNQCLQASRELSRRLNYRPEPPALRRVA